MFKQNGFHAGRSEYYHVANSHLDRVIDDREGLPITMSILYMELGRRLEMRIDGVGLPGRFIVNHVISDKDDDNQLIDVFDGGKLLSIRCPKSWRGASVRGQTHQRPAPTAGPANFLLALSRSSVDPVDQATCLLYTSPSPRDQRGSRMPSSA